MASARHKLIVSLRKSKRPSVILLNTYTDKIESLNLAFGFVIHKYII